VLIHAVNGGNSKGNITAEDFTDNLGVEKAVKKWIGCDHESVRPSQRLNEKQQTNRKAM